MKVYKTFSLVKEKYNQFYEIKNFFKNKVTAFRTLKTSEKISNFIFICLFFYFIFILKESEQVILAVITISFLIIALSFLNALFYPVLSQLTLSQKHTVTNKKLIFWLFSLLTFLFIFQIYLSTPPIILDFPILIEKHNLIVLTSGFILVFATTLMVSTFFLFAAVALTSTKPGDHLRELFISHVKLPASVMLAATLLLQKELMPLTESAVPWIYGTFGFIGLFFLLINIFLILGKLIFPISENQQQNLVKTSVFFKHIGVGLVIILITSGLVSNLLLIENQADLSIFSKTAFFFFGFIEVVGIMAFVYYTLLSFTKIFRTTDLKADQKMKWTATFLILSFIIGNVWKQMFFSFSFIHSISKLIILFWTFMIQMNLLITLPFAFLGLGFLVATSLIIFQWDIVYQEKIEKTTNKLFISIFFFIILLIFIIIVQFYQIFSIYITFSCIGWSIGMLLTNLSLLFFFTINKPESFKFYLSKELAILLTMVTILMVIISL